jgi:hypothetical protein
VKRVRSNIGTAARLSDNRNPTDKASETTKPVIIIKDVHPREFPKVIVNKKVSKVKAENIAPAQS